MMDHPRNTDSPEIRATKEHELSTVFMQYLSFMGSVFRAWKEDQEEYKMLMEGLLRYPIELYLISKIKNGTLLELG